MRDLTFLVDMDGPIADFDSLFFDRCAANGWDLDCVRDEQTHRFADNHIVNRQHRALAREMVRSSGWFADLPLVPWAQAGLEALRAHGEVWICTKPLEDNPTCRDEKAAWVQRHLGQDWVKRLIITPDKSMVRGDILLDDAPYLDWLPRADWTIAIFPAPWNGEGSKWGHLPRWSWDDSVHSLLTLAAYAQ